jgi:nucleoside-diphosphate-sugar epimerase
MNNIVITGATSFIGIALIKELLKNGFFVYGVVRKNSIHISLLNEFSQSKNFKIIECDMSNYSTLGNIIHGEIDAFIHLAWDGIRGATRMDKNLQKNNFLYSKEALNACYNMGCSYFIDAGSQAEYGPILGPVSENATPIPNTEYGREKLSFFQYAENFCSQNNVVYLHPRFFSIYGPGDNPKTLIMSTINKMFKNQPCYFTKAIQMWNYLYIDDLVYMLANLIENHVFGTINFGGVETKPLKEFIYDMERVLGSSSELIFGAIEYPLTGPVSTFPNVDKLYNMMERKCITSFSQGILNIAKEITL